MRRLQKLQSYILSYNSLQFKRYTTVPVVSYFELGLPLVFQLYLISSLFYHVTPPPLPPPPFPLTFSFALIVYLILCDVNFLSNWFCRKASDYIAARKLFVNKENCKKAFLEVSCYDHFLPLALLKQCLAFIQVVAFQK